jgi:parallel beta-helix repeat protein
VNSVDRRWVAVFLVLVVTLSAIAVFLTFGTPHHPTEEVRHPPTPHSPITLTAQSDFTKPGAGSGCECVRSGSGTEADPFVISDWIINATDSNGIDISGTKLYFVIARVELRGPSDDVGVNVDEAENVIVKDSRMTSWWFGAYAFLSSNLEFTNNTVVGNQYGIQLEACSNNQLLDNKFEKNGQLGIFLRGPNNILRGNSVIRNGWGGINVDGTAGSVNANQIENNVVSDNAVFGIGIWRAANNVLRNNTVVNNQGVGIVLTDDCTQNTIEANTVSGNGGSGIILVDGSSGNTIRQNTARRNGDGVKDFDLYDMVSGNVWQNNTYDSKKPDSIN